MAIHPGHKQKIQVAAETPFDNLSNGFIADNSQSATEEIDFRQETQEPTGFLDRTQCTISWSDINLRFTIAPVSTSFIYFVKGIKYEKMDSETVDITDTEGLWFIYYENDVLTTSQTPWTFGSNIVFIAIVQWDATNKTAILFGDERHGLVMDWATHKRLHSVAGMGVEQYTLLAGDYLLNANGSLDAHAQFSLTNGTVHDEDLIFKIINAAIPTNPFEQKISPIVYLPKYYQLGNSGVWRKQAATAFPLTYTTGNRAQYNYYNPTTMQWSLQTVANDYYICMWVMVTNNIYEPVIVIVGQEQYIDPLTADAQEQFSALSITGLPFQEKTLLYRVMFRTSDLYMNTPKSIITNLVGPQVPSNLAQAIINKRLTSSTLYTTTSNTYVPITSFTITPESGTYAIWYNADVIISANNALAYTVAAVDGVALADSARTVQGVGSNFNSQTSLITTYGFNGSQMLSFQVKVTSGSFSTYDRTLILIRLGPT